MLPNLKTARLMLKPRTMNDFESCLEMDKDPEITEYIPDVWDSPQKRFFRVSYQYLQHHFLIS